jgi:hypothetical protein
VEGWLETNLALTKEDVVLDAADRVASQRTSELWSSGVVRESGDEVSDPCTV